MRSNLLPTWPSPPTHADGDLVNIEDDNDLSVAKSYCNGKLRLTVFGMCFWEIVP